MGIKLLNKLIKLYGGQSNYLYPLLQLRGKKIVIDIMIYLYRFKSEGDPDEQMYSLCSLFIYYNIDVLFIFDGKNIPQKKEEINRRRIRKVKAKNEYDNLKIGNKRKKQKLKRIWTTINYKDILRAKEIIAAFGLLYTTAINEADILCAKMVIEGDAWACLSEDTDLFVYGCPRILRYLSLFQHTIVLYKLDELLQNLHLELNNFQKLCICSGTDYDNINKNIFDLFKQKEFELTDAQKKIYKIYDIKAIPKEKIVIKNNSVNKKELERIMQKSNFIFI